MLIRYDLKYVCHKVCKTPINITLQHAKIINLFPMSRRQNWCHTTCAYFIDIALNFTRILYADHAESKSNICSIWMCQQPSPWSDPAMPTVQLNTLGIMYHPANRPWPRYTFERIFHMASVCAGNSTVKLPIAQEGLYQRTRMFCLHILDSYCNLVNMIHPTTKLT